MAKKPIIEPTEDIECPECGEAVSVRLEICPRCEFLLH